MEDDEIFSPNSSDSPSSHTTKHLSTDEEIRLAGSPHSGSSIHSFEEGGEEEEINSLDQINSLSGGESEEDFMIPSHLDSSEEGEEESRNPNFRWRSEDDEDFSSRSHKRLKSPGEDRISALPDGVILHILSLLSAKWAIRTEVLSKRWMRLWESTPNLIFHFHDVRGKEWGYDFYSKAVNKTLIMHSATKIKKFHFHFHKDRIARSDSVQSHFRLRSYIDSWLSFAKRRNVEELSLKFKLFCYEIPQNILNCSSLRKLNSKGCDYYETKGQVSWESLRELTIARSHLSYDVLHKILLGSPRLECLNLKDVVMFTTNDDCSTDVSWTDEILIDVSLSSCLERLVIERTARRLNSGSEMDEMRVSIPPSLKSLEILGLWKGTRFVLLNASSLVNVNLELAYVTTRKRDEDCVDIFIQLIQQVDHAEQLTLGSFGVQVFSMLEDTISPSPTPNYHCKVLILNLEAIRDHELLGIARLLYHFQGLEKLVVSFTHNQNKDACPSFGPYRKFEDIWSSQGRPSGVLLQHLKTIEFLGLVHIDDVFAGFVQYLLQNASVLEKMVLRSKRPLMDPSNCYKIARTLLTIPKASPRAVVLLPDFHEHEMQ